jgi:hypothetical protein
MRSFSSNVSSTSTRKTTGNRPLMPFYLQRCALNSLRSSSRMRPINLIVMDRSPAVVSIRNVTRVRYCNARAAPNSLITGDRDREIVLVWAFAQIWARIRCSASQAIAAEFLGTGIASQGLICANRGARGSAHPVVVISEHARYIYEPQTASQIERWLR